MKMKLWQKKYQLDKQVEEFTVGNDIELDKELIIFDCIGSIAHAKMLVKIGILTSEEFKKLQKELKQIIKLAEKGKFEIKQKDEDVHTAVENYLTKSLGKIGKKIHTARSRNDQVLVDTRLYTKHKLNEVSEVLHKLVDTLLKLGKKNEFIPMPGYTHMQKAMPSSIGLWATAFAESLLNDGSVISNAYQINDQCPLGSAAGYGINVPIDRSYTAKLLGFSSAQNNVLYVQNSRGKIELVVLSSLMQVMLDINKMASDLILFSMPEFGYFSLPDKFCTGSSIMPQKKNPDVLELARAKSAVMQGYVIQLMSLSQNLISGYNRDFQLTKEPLLKGLELAINTINVMDLVLKGLKVNKDNCVAGCSIEIFATDYTNQMVMEGTPFRTAYKKTAQDIKKLKTIDPVKNIKSKKHLGATGKLPFNQLKSLLNQGKKLLQKQKKQNNVISKLLK